MSSDEVYSADSDGIPRSIESRDLYAERPLRSLSETLSLVRRLHPNRSEEYILKQWERLTSLRDEVYALHEMTCSVCCIHGTTPYEIKRPLVRNLSEDCQFCGILRKCHQHFAKDCESMEMFFQDRTSNLQICFGGVRLSRPECPRSARSRYDECGGIHVQLHTQEPRRQNEPFRYSREIYDAISDASIGLMEEWIDHCDITHQHALSVDFKPTRLIRLAKDRDDSAHLYSPGTRVKFAALSYRWGPSRQSETTKDNVSERSKDMKTSEFPKTLQDAINVTRRLGLEFIWIDRICIVQNDEDDWAKEASLMADIYANAHVVLSATATEDCEDGFLQKRVEPLVIQYTPRGSEACKVRARRIGSHTCKRDVPKKSFTLFQRGWCMQERLLARRVIHFLPDEILFECQTERKCECGGARTEIDASVQSYAFLSFAEMKNISSIKAEHVLFAGKWWSLVRDYSNMELMYGKDSLPALSGIAATIERLKPGKYIAGHWEHEIAIQLGWYVEPGPSSRRWKYPEDVDILGPTFAWSSHVRPLGLGGAPHEPQSICTLESSHVDLATNNPYGQVLYAFICLCGWIVPGDEMVLWLKTTNDESGRYTGRVSLDSGFQFNDSLAYNLPGHAEYEELRSMISWESVICFGLYEYSSEGDGVNKVDALLLQTNKTGTGEYIRIGIVRKLCKSWFDEHAVESTVTIV